MRDEDVLAMILESEIISRWHFFQYHFSVKARLGSQPFADAIVRAIADCERMMPGYAKRSVETLASIGGRPMHVPDYEQLLQVLSELLVVRHMVTFPWNAGPTLQFDAGATAGGKNPEVLLKWPGRAIGVEVKTPSLLAHWHRRGENPVQVLPRSPFLEILGDVAGGKDRVTLPRDNPIKDFIASAQEKFEPLKGSEHFESVLVIVWDGALMEPRTALLHPKSGLLTKETFAPNLKFAAVDNIVLTPHLAQLTRASRADSSNPWIEGDPLSYGEPGEVPFKLLVRVPGGGEMSPDLRAALQVVEGDDPVLGADHQILDWIQWIDPSTQAEA
jgi:hypothetical protein